MNTSLTKTGSSIKANKKVEPCLLETVNGARFETSKTDDQANDSFEDKGIALTGKSHLRKNGQVKAKPERTCLVTREINTCDMMIRFVLSPDNIVTPDVKAKLPGRGVWIKAERSLIEQAVQKNLFSRGFKNTCTCLPDLALQVDQILSKFTLGALSMARLSGSMVTGFSKVDKLIRNNEASIVLEAKDGSDDGLRKILQAVRSVEVFGGEPPAVWQLFASDEMDFSSNGDTANQIDSVQSGKNVIHMALNRSPAAKAARKRIERLIAYRGIEQVDVAAKKKSNTTNRSYKLHQGRKATNSRTES